MMEIPDDRISKFFQKHHVFTLATVRENCPWCCNCFYVYQPSEVALIFTSDLNTRHAKEALAHPVASGSVVLETKIVGKIQGLQFEGVLSVPEGEWLAKCRKVYLQRFPYAILMETTLWVFTLKTIKMTDNQLGFGKKIYWARES
ncbi:MAG: pyridoxamine 5'-phosphate oxidase family protein [Bacteroidales bacterium]|nr:pyridoxamine 5'-phosphate oxidase family protein [Bacteroidales bacterium]